MEQAKKKILYLVTEDWFFCSHFIERAIAAQNAGYDVVVLTHIDTHGDILKKRGLRVIPLKLDRGSLNPFKEWATIAQIYKVYRAEKPDIAHHVALKPVLYGTIAALMAGARHILNAPVGMGYIFTSPSLKARLLRLPVKLGLLFLLNPRGSKVVFENRDDLVALVNGGYVRQDDAVLIRGAGVDLSRYHPASAPPEGVVKVILTARMLWDKGIGEFIDAARNILKRNYQAKFILVGAPDPLNRAAISEATLKQWVKEGIVDWLGKRDDIPGLLAESHIMCLPSYREGLPKSILEALATGLPVVTTDVPGCREVVSNGINGLLVPARDARALEEALIDLIQHPEKRMEMGRKGRMRAENEFSKERVIKETLTLYWEMVGG